MNKNIKKAEWVISDNPYDRVSGNVKKIIKESRFSIDTHGHLMTKEYMSGSYKLLKAVAGKKNREKKNTIERLLQVLDQDNLEQVVDLFQRDFAPLKPVSIMTAMMMDLEFGIPLTSDQQYARQLNELNRLGKDREVLPFLGIDPRRLDVSGEDNLWHMFFYAFGDGGYFTGLKFYPSLGFLPSHPALMPFFEICEAKSIPVTTHCGGPHVSTIKGNLSLTGEACVDHWYRLSRKEQKWETWDRRILRGSRKRKAEFLSEPLLWLPVLKAFPKLKLNLGHLGGKEHWEIYFKKGYDRRLEDIQFLMREYDNVYGDISGFPIHPNLYRSYLKDSYDLPLKERALYGSDYWISLALGTLQESILFYKLVTPQKWRILFEQENPMKFLFGITGNSVSNRELYQQIQKEDYPLVLS